jgi:hypothetical protein
MVSCQPRAIGPPGGARCWTATSHPCQAVRPEGPPLGDALGWLGRRPARGDAPGHRSDARRAIRGGATSRPRPARWPAPGSKSPAPPRRSGRETSQPASGPTGRHRGRRAEASNQAGQRGSVDASGGAGQIMMIQEGVGGVLECDRGDGESNDLPPETSTSWCRSKRGQLAHPTLPRQPRSTRWRQGVAAANRLFAAIALKPRLLELERFAV